MTYLSIKESTYRFIKEKLLNAGIPPGSRIREDILAEEISVSRTPVREAINQLMAEGFVNVVPRKGIFFIELTPDDILDLLEVREVLETLAVRKSIDRINDIQRGELEELLDQFENALREERYQDCNILDSRYHQKIAEISGNRKLIEFIGILEDFMRIVRNMEMKDIAGKHKAALEDHRQILKAIRSKDKEEAERGVRRNIGHMKKNLGLTEKD